MSGHLPRVTPTALDAAVLARLLYFCAGVTRYTNEGRRRTWFRASASAGNLHPLELYAACGALNGMDRGLYHVDPAAFGLARLRPVDVRAHHARTAGDPALAGTAVVIIITGIPWRTADSLEENLCCRTTSAAGGRDGSRRGAASIVAC